MGRAPTHGTDGAPSWWRTRAGVAVTGFALVGAFCVSSPVR